jgi:transcriptional regulator with XRE-family HTH domain
MCEEAMLSKTLNDALGQYEIGDKLRALRLQRHMSLVELGRHTGLSPALLSKVERARLFPTLSTLLRIALVYGVGLGYFFRADHDAPLVALVRRKERMRFPDRRGGKRAAYYFESLDFPATERKLNAYYAEFQDIAASAAQRHQHSGVEMMYLLSGKLLLTVHNREYLLTAGDSVYFDSSVPHGYQRKGRSVCAAIVVTTP